MHYIVIVQAFFYSIFRTRLILGSVWFCHNINWPVLVGLITTRRRDDRVEYYYDDYRFWDRLLLGDVVAAERAH